MIVLFKKVTYYKFLVSSFSVGFFLFLTAHTAQARWPADQTLLNSATVVVSWKTVTPTIGILPWGTDPTFGQTSFKCNIHPEQYFISLPGLIPTTTTWYRMNVDGISLGAAGHDVIAGLYGNGIINGKQQ